MLECLSDFRRNFVHHLKNWLAKLHCFNDECNSSCKLEPIQIILHFDPSAAINPITIEFSGAPIKFDISSHMCPLQLSKKARVLMVPVTSDWFHLLAT